MTSHPPGPLDIGRPRVGEASPIAVAPQFCALGSAIGGEEERRPRPWERVWDRVSCGRGASHRRRLSGRVACRIAHVRRCGHRSSRPCRRRQPSAAATSRCPRKRRPRRTHRAGGELDASREVSLMISTSSRCASRNARAALAVLLDAPDRMTVRVPSRTPSSRKSSIRNEVKKSGRRSICWSS